MIIDNCDYREEMVSGNEVASELGNWWLPLGHMNWFQKWENEVHKIRQKPNEMKFIKED